MWSMKNTYRTDNDRVLIKIPLYCREEHDPSFLETQIDTADLPLVSAPNCTWSANPAAAPAGKFYANAKIKDPLAGRFKTVLMHRLIMGDPRLPNGTAIEVHHADNDGLNNRRYNITPTNHQGNLRARSPNRDWSLYDFSVDRAVLFKRFVAIGNDIGKQFDIGRAQMWNIRNNIIDSKASQAYWRAVCEAFPDLFWREQKEAPWIFGPGIYKTVLGLVGESKQGGQPTRLRRDKAAF